MRSRLRFTFEPTKAEVVREGAGLAPFVLVRLARGLEYDILAGLTPSAARALAIELTNRAEELDRVASDGGLLRDDR